MRRCPWILACVSFALLRAQAAEPAPSEFPFEYREGLLWVRAAAPQSAAPVNLLLDTGAGASVLNTATAERLHLKLGRAVCVQGVETSLTGHWLSSVSIAASGVPLPSNYLAVDLEKLSRSCHQEVDGLIGADFFRGRIIQIDFGKHLVRVIPPQHTPIPGEVVPLELRPCGMRLPVRVNGNQRQWVRLDTGCASALQWVTSKVRPDQCGRKPAIGLAEISIPQAETSVQIGMHQFQKVPTGLHEHPIFAGEAGLLGNALLCRLGKVTIDAKSSQFIIRTGDPVP